MAKKPMNKFVLLPLFLGVTCLLSAGLIAGVNSFTEPVIQQRIIDQQNAGYYKVLGIQSADQPVNQDIASLSSAGVTSKKQFKSGDTLIGYVYDVTVKGYGGDIKYQVGFKAGNFSGFNVIAHEETPSFGGVILENNGAKVDARLKNQSASADILALINGSDNLTAGRSMTRNALVNSLNAIASDYLTEAL